MRNNLKRSEKLEGMNFTVEMETGTGKTYVYLKSIYELNKNYGFTKFVIVVPSIAIREGVYKTLQITKEHFNSINTPIGNKEIKPYLHGGTENSIGTISFNLDDIEIDTKEIIDLETNELDIELLSSEEIENMYKEDTNNANSI